MLRNLAPSVRRTLLAGALTLSAAAAPAAASGDGWYADFDVAAEVAKKENKDLLVDFTGSDWCGWCIKLDNEVFSEEVWQKGVEKEYVLVALDFPNADELKAQVPNPERNRELQDKYGVRGFPTILMMTPDGEVYGQTGYQSGGPENYLEHMAELRENRALMFEAMELAEKFDGVEGDARWTTAAAMMELSAKFDATQPFARHLEAGMRWAFEEDADNARGVRLGAAAFLLARGDDASDYYQVVLDLDPKNEGGFLERAVATRFDIVRDDESARAALAALELLGDLKVQDKELYFGMLFNAAMWSRGPLQDEEGAKKYAKKALEVGTDDKQRREAIEQILG